VDAPASITSVPESDIRLYGSSGQVPNILAGVPGAELTQSGLYDYNFNLRGFNTPLNRRVQALIDGRNPSVPFLGNQEWSALSLTAGELEAVEVLRGPSAALYGANTFNGVVNMRTKAPRESPGGRLRFTSGELDTYMTDARWATGLGRGWYLKLVGGHSSSGDFARSRNSSVEYPGLPREVLALQTDTVTISSGSARADKYFASGRWISLEGGGEAPAGTVFVIGAGRAQTDAVRSWSRFRFNSPGWSILAYSNTRDASDTAALFSGASLFLEDRNVQIEFQGNRDLGRNARLIAGAIYGREWIDSADRQGRQTLVSKAVGANREAAFGHLRYNPAEAVSLSIAARIDESTLHDVQVSPRAAAVFRITPAQSVRASYGRAFQVGNYGELFTRVPVGTPLDLSQVEAQLAPLLGGVSLGLNSVPILALGNEHLFVEKVRSFEAGYQRLLGVRGIFTFDYYRNRMQDFITQLLPGVNPSYPAYRAPTVLPQQVRSIVEGVLNPALPGLTNDPSGNPLIVLSFGNAGLVDSQGIEAGVTTGIRNHWQVGLTYSWFDFSVKRSSPAAEVFANAPRHKVAANLGYHKPRFDIDLRHRWINGFFWGNGIFVGPVPSYNVVDLAARYQISPRWEAGVNVSNLLSNSHYELFGGDLLERRALGYIAFSWR
jgi:outer membrane receptor protein involved in Fe transport